MDRHDTSGGGIAAAGLSRRRVLQLAGAGAAAGALGLASGVAGAQPVGACGALDLVIALDGSGTMRMGSPSRMALAKAGATALVESLGVSPGGAHVGVLMYAGTGGDGDVPVFQPLTDDPSVARAAIAGIPDQPKGMANMEAGVQAAREELAGIDYTDDVEASGNHRPDVPSFLVLLASGLPLAGNDPYAINDGSTFPGLGGADPSEEAAAARTVDGIEVYAIGVDMNATGEALMVDMASAPAATHAFPNVAPDRIGAAFDAVAGDLCVTAVDVDVMPGTDTNAINCHADREGVIPVAVLGSDAFDVTTLDPSSLRFGSRATVAAGDGATLAHGGGHLEDANDDGYPDLVGHFPAADAGFASGDVEAVLVGETVDGGRVLGTDDVTLVGNC